MKTLFEKIYSCLTYSDALTYSEVFRFYLRRYSKFRRNTLMDIFVNTCLTEPHTVMGSFLSEGYWKLSLKQINSAGLASQFRRVFRPIVRKRSGQYLSERYGAEI